MVGVQSSGRVRVRVWELAFPSACHRLGGYLGLVRVRFIVSLRHIYIYI